MWVFEFIFFFILRPINLNTFFQIKNRNNVSVSMEFLLHFQTGDKFKFKTWKSLDPGKSHVGVSESLWIWQIQIQNLKNHRTWEIACWCEWVFLNLSNRNIEIINNPLIPLKWHDIIDGFSFIDKMQRVPWICITYIHLYCVYILYLQYIYIRK